MIDLATYPRRYITVKALVLCSGLPRRTVYRHIERGWLRSEWYGPRRLVPTVAAREWFERYVEGCRPETQADTGRHNSMPSP